MFSMSVSEFRSFCEKLHPECYVFSTENQSPGVIRDTIKATARYPVMYASINPNSVCFKNDASCICFDRVSEIIVSPDRCAVGVVFTIVCSGDDTSGKSGSYTMIAD